MPVKTYGCMYVCIAINIQYICMAIYIHTYIYIVLRATSWKIYIFDIMANVCRKVNNKSRRGGERKSGRDCAVIGVAKSTEVYSRYFPFCFALFLFLEIISFGKYELYNALQWVEQKREREVWRVSAAIGVDKLKYVVYSFFSFSFSTWQLRIE